MTKKAERFNEMDKIKIIFKNAKTPRSLWQEVERRMHEKRNRSCKRERFALTSAGSFRLKGLFSTWLLEVTRLFYKVLGGFVCGLCLLLVIRQAETNNTKAPLDINMLNLDLFTAGDTNSLSVRCNHFIWIQEWFPQPQNGCWTQK